METKPNIWWDVAQEQNVWKVFVQQEGMRAREYVPRPATEHDALRHAALHVVSLLGHEFWNEGVIALARRAQVEPGQVLVELERKLPQLRRGRPPQAEAPHTDP